MTESGQDRPDLLFVFETCVIGTNRDFQGSQHRAREIKLSSAHENTVRFLLHSAKLIIQISNLPFVFVLRADFGNFGLRLV